MSEALPTPAAPAKPGDQALVSGNGPVISLQRPQYSNLEVVGTLEGLANKNPRSFGEAGMAEMLVSVFKEVSGDATESRQSLSDTVEKLAEAKKENAILQERLKSLKRLRLVRNLVQSGGTIILSISIKLIDSPNRNVGVGLALLAVLLIVSSWFLDAQGTTK